MSLLEALALKPVAATIGRVEITKVVCDASSNPGVAGQDLTFAFAKEHAFVHQPIAHSQSGGRAVSDQRGGLGSRELEEYVIHHVGESLWHELFTSQQKPEGVQIHHHPAGSKPAACDDGLPGGGEGGGHLALPEESARL
eukprot:6383766-Amphidinium_carterae.3